MEAITVPRDQIDFVTPKVHSAEAIAKAIWERLVGFVREYPDSATHTYIGAMVGSESECKPLVYRVKMELSSRFDNARYDIKLHAVEAIRCDGSRWAVVADIYT